jgi:hypothetical protein
MVSLDDVEIARIGEYWFVVAGTRARAYEGSSDHQTFKSRRTDVVCNPDFEAIGAFKMDGIPDGTRATDEDAPGIAHVWSKGRVVTKARFVEEQYQSLIGQPIPPFDGVGIDLAADHTKGKAVLICFFDYQQRPSRASILQVAQRAERLRGKAVSVIAIQASKTAETSLKAWTKENGLTFPVGMIQGDEEKLCRTWGVKSLPWLILADKGHVVRAEGFSAGELERVLEKVR